MKPLGGQVAVVAGATRGAGRGVARMLGEAGATVYCTGRSSRGRRATHRHHYAGRPETIGRHYVHVEAGIKIRHLLDDLAHCGLSLPTMGDGAGQSLCVGCHKVGGVGGNPHPTGWSSKLPLAAMPCRMCHPIGSRP